MPEGSAANRAASPSGCSAAGWPPGRTKRRGLPRGRALRRTPCCPFPRTRTKGNVTAGRVCSATFRSWSVVSPEGWPEPRHWQRSRKRVSGARLRGASAHSSSLPARRLREGGRPRRRSGGPCLDNWVRRGVSVSLGRGRPRRCAKELRRASAPGSSAVCSSPQCGKQRPPDTPRCRRGPYQRRATCANPSVGWS